MDDLDKILYNLQEINQGVLREFNKKKNEVIREALIRNNFNPNDTQFLKENFHMTVDSENRFLNLYYTPESRRIISFQITYPTEIPNPNEDYANIKITGKYY